MDNNLRKQQIPFTQVPNELLYNPNVSFKAKGIWAYMSAKPEGWQFSATRIAEETKEDRKAVLSGLKELSEAGYITAKKLGNGRIEYTLHWEVATSPVPKVQDQQEPEKTEEPAKKPSEVGSRPLRADYKSDEEWEEALYSWNKVVV